MLMLTLKYSPTDYSLHASPHLPPFPLQIHHAFALMRTFAAGENEICKMILWGFLHCFARCWNGPVVDVSRVDGTMDGWNYRRLASKCEAEYWSLFMKKVEYEYWPLKNNLTYPTHPIVTGLMTSVMLTKYCRCLNISRLYAFGMTWDSKK